MLNDDSIIKYSINQLAHNYMPGPECDNWVDYTRFIQSQIKYIKGGFPGISNSDLQLIDNSKLQPNMRIILDDNLDANCGVTNTDRAAILGLIRLIPDENTCVLEIEGIGQGFDFTRDPDRLLRPGKIIEIDLRQYHCVLQMITTPKTDGSPVYYYYNKSQRDYRY